MNLILYTPTDDPATNAVRWATSHGWTDEEIERVWQCIRGLQAAAARVAKEKGEGI